MYIDVCFYVSMIAHIYMYIYIYICIIHLYIYCMRIFTYMYNSKLNVRYYWRQGPRIYIMDNYSMYTYIAWIWVYTWPQSPRKTQIHRYIVRFLLIRRCNSNQSCSYQKLEYFVFTYRPNKGMCGFSILSMVRLDFQETTFSDQSNKKQLTNVGLSRSNIGRN